MLQSGVPSTPWDYIERTSDEICHSALQDKEARRDNPPPLFRHSWFRERLFDVEPVSLFGRQCFKWWENSAEANSGTPAYFEVAFDCLCNCSVNRFLPLPTSGTGTTPINRPNYSLAIQHIHVNLHLQYNISTRKDPTPCTDGWIWFMTKSVKPFMALTVWNKECTMEYCQREMGVCNTMERVWARCLTKSICDS